MADYSYKDAHKVISDAITVLEEAERNADNSDEQVAIIDLLDVLREERTKINVARLAQSNEAYKVLTDNAKSLVSELKKVESKVKALIKAAEVLAKAAGALTKLVELAAKAVI